jgi:hypothetical protein
MSMKQKTALLTVLAALVYVTGSAGQDVRPVPGAGTGIVTVQGTVNVADIANMPAVRQGSEWRVSFAATPDVRVSAVATHPFLTFRGRYRVTWTPGQTEDIVISELGPGGWVRVDAGGRLRWVNLDRAQAFEVVEGK